MSDPIHTEEVHVRAHVRVHDEGPSIIGALDIVRSEVVRLLGNGFDVHKITIEEMRIQRYEPPPGFDTSYPILIVASRNVEHP